MVSAPASSRGWGRSLSLWCAALLLVVFGGVVHADPTIVITTTTLAGDRIVKIDCSDCEGEVTITWGVREVDCDTGLPVVPALWGPEADVECPRAAVLNGDPCAQGDCLDVPYLWECDGDSGSGSQDVPCP